MNGHRSRIDGDSWRTNTGLAALAVAVLATAMACSGDPTCGNGAVLRAGICELATPVTCGEGTQLKDGVCTADGEPGACTPQCSLDAKACGNDGCGGSCGTCADGEHCAGGHCEVDDLTCIPHCTDKTCGDDGCGGSCGKCPGGETCQADKCVPGCVPDCIAKGCGDDGCGGSCGTCDGELICGKSQICVPKVWTCDGARYGHDGFCDCGCGAHDPDCDNTAAPLLGCAPFHTCDKGGCVSTVPKDWTCLSAEYDDGIHCDCGCGAHDPDCDSPGTGTGDCAVGQVCGKKGACEVCKPSCAGKTCGGDGCGGSCGGCPAPTKTNPNIKPMACVGGKCIDGCLPSPLLCDTNACGDDGCGGSCGNCKAGEFCNKGQCAIEPGKSCLGFCKGDAPAGCSCAFGCKAKGNCCPDYEGVCVCKPDCDGRVCGSDGCGGTCGKCPNDKKYCDAAGQCNTTCQPVCTGKTCGADGCGGSCGSCADGGTCNTDGKCVPASWLCLDIYYADGSLCDCSCGAPDPDCKAIALTKGCPLATSCEASTGVCKVPFCTHNGDCKAPQWCVGHYSVGKGQQKGICALPNPQALATGSSCTTNNACATGLCLAGACRKPCEQDSHCATGVSCLALVPPQGLAGKPKGAVSACYGSVTLGKACAKQADCTGGNEGCLALLQPVTLKPIFRCGELVSTHDEGSKCQETANCAPGLLCAAGVCRRACPGGAADCPTGLSCKPAVLFNGALTSTDDDVKVNACTAGGK